MDWSNIIKGDGWEEFGVEQNCTVRGATEYVLEIT